jgi:hypothetical protein
MQDRCYSNKAWMEPSVLLSHPLASGVYG